MVIRVAIFLLVGLLLVGANAWFVMAVRSAFFDRHAPNRIAPFRIIGREDKNGTLGLAMAHQLQARLALLQREIEEFRPVAAEKPPGGEGPGAGIRPSGIELPEFEVPDQVFTPLDITLNIAGVEVGGVLSRVHRFLTAPQVFDFVVEFQKQEAIIVGNLDLLEGPPLYVRARPTADEIVTTIAYGIYQRNLARNIEAVGVLELADFRRLMETLKGVVQLNGLVRQRAAGPGDFQALLPRLKESVEKTPRWPELVHLTAEIAENADAPDDALALYRQEMALREADSAVAGDISQRIARLVKTLQVAAREPAVEARDPDATLKQLRDSPWGRALLATLGISPRPAADLSESPTIAILGPQPRPDLLPENQRTLLGGESRSPDYETRYMNDLVRLVRLVAPSARFVFTAVQGSFAGGYTETEIIQALNSLLETSPDILLVTYGPLWTPVFGQVFREASDRGTLVVEAAYSPIPGWEQMQVQVFPETLTVGGLGRENEPVQPLQQGIEARELLWAPGQDLPTLGGSGRIEPRTGHSYATAVAVGLLWYLKENARDLTPGEMVEVLRRTSRQVGDGLGMIDLRVALAEVQHRRRGPAIRLTQEQSIPIPDNDPQGIASSLEVSETGVIKRIQVAIDIIHTWVGDLVVTLVPPQGEPIVLHNRQGGSGNNLKRTYSAELGSLIGREAQGEWTLLVKDLSLRDVGRINRWTLDIGLEQ